MNTHQFAKVECANYDGGGCNNVFILENLSNHVQKRLDKCRLLDNQKCRYFENCVLPMKNFAKDEQRLKMIQSAAADYKMSMNVSFTAYDAPNSRLNAPSPEISHAPCILGLSKMKISKNANKNDCFKK